MTALRKVEAQECAALGPRCVCICGDIQRENSVPVNLGHKQFRCPAFVNSDRDQPLAYESIVTLPGQSANYQPVTDRVALEAAWRQFNEQGEALKWLITVSIWIEYTKTGTAFGFMSLAGIPRKTASSSCVKAMPMNAPAQLLSSRRSTRGWNEH